MCFIILLDYDVIIPAKKVLFLVVLFGLNYTKNTKSIKANINWGIITSLFHNFIINLSAL